MSDALTALALIVSAIGIILGFIQWRRNQKREEGKLHISATFKSQTEGGISLRVKLLNKGKTSVYVEEIKVVLKTGRTLPYEHWRGFSLEKPIEVTEGIPKEVLFPLYKYMDEIREPNQIDHVVVVDTLGQQYRYPGRIRSKRAFQQQIGNEWTEETQKYWEEKLKEDRST